MDLLITIAVIGIAPLGLYLIAKMHPPAAKAMGKHPGIVITIVIVSAIVLSFAFHDMVVAPCRATTKLHSVTDNLGNFYSTEYKDSGDWCIWIRGTF